MTTLHWLAGWLLNHLPPTGSGTGNGWSADPAGGGQGVAGPTCRAVSTGPRSRRELLAAGAGALTKTAYSATPI